MRLLTTKPTPATRYHKASPSHSRGIGFIEFPDSNSLRLALALHHTELDGNVINVELTAGGGGAGEDRKRKLQERNERVDGQRKRKEEEEGEGEDEVEEVGPDGEKKKVKTRGGRRGKQVRIISFSSASSLPSSSTSERADQRVLLHNKTDDKDKDKDSNLLPGWGAFNRGGFASEATAPSRGGRDGGRGGPGAGGRGRGRGGSVGRGGRSVWQPTGSNAAPVG